MGVVIERTHCRMSENSGLKQAVPPYLPFKTLIGFVDELRVAMPQKIDRSLMKSMSGVLRKSPDRHTNLIL